MIGITVGCNTIDIRQLQVPRGTIMVSFTQNNGVMETKRELFFTEEEFLKFFKPLVNYYEGVKNEQHRD